MKRIKITDSKRKEIIEQYQAGMSVRALAAQVGMCPDTVRSVLGSAGVPLRNVQQARAVFVHQSGTSEQSRREAIRQSIRQCETIQEAAVRLKLSTRRVKQVLDAMRQEGEEIAFATTPRGFARMPKEKHLEAAQKGGHVSVSKGFAVTGDAVEMSHRSWGEGVRVRTVS